MAEALRRLYDEAAQALIRLRRRRRAARGAVRQHVGEIVDSAAGARRAFAFRGRTRHESSETFVPSQLAARLRKQVHTGREAARHQHRVAFDATHGPHLAVAALARETALT